MFDGAKWERLAMYGVKAGVLCAPLLCAIGCFLITASTDECWILEGVRGLADHGTYGQGSPFRSVHSTGGAYTLAATVLYKAGQGRLEIVRVVSVASVAGLLYALLRWNALATGRKDEAGWLGAAALFAVPGTFMLGSQAYGEVLATLLVVVGAMLWGTLPAGTWRRRLWVGVILGMAGATRLNCLLALAGLPAAALFPRDRRRDELVEAGLTLLVGMAVFLIAWKLLWWFSVDPGSADASRKVYGRQTPWGVPPGYLVPLWLDFWSIGRDFLPFFVLATISAGWAWARPRVASPRGADLLLSSAWLMWLAWHAQSPIAHLRYLWPALACFAAVGGLALSVLYQQIGEARPPSSRQAVVAVALAVLVTGYMDAARTFLHGDGDVLSWEWQRATAHTFQFGPFRSLRSQKAVVHRLREIPTDQTIATFGFDAALSFLTKRSIRTVGSYYPGAGARDDAYQASSDSSAGKLPRWIVLTPFVNRFPNGHLDAALHRWIEDNCRLDVRFGPYVVYEVTGRFPPTSEIFTLDLWEPRLPLVPRP